jgi:hypothetical protein
VVFEALLESTPFANLLGDGAERVIDAQPSLGISLGERGDLQANFEVRTRPRVPVAGERGGDPISVFLTVRKFGPLGSLDDLKGAFGAVVGYAEQLAETRVVPHLVMPIHEVLSSRG